MQINSDLTQILFSDVVEYGEDDIITFKRGILGFDDLTKFIILGEVNNESAICFLQSIEKPAISFVLTEPFKFVSNYDFALDQDFIADLEIEDVSHIAVYAIVNIKDDIKTSTMNLKAPIILNIKNKLAGQTIITEEYDVKYHFLNQASSSCS